MCRPIQARSVRAGGSICILSIPKPRSGSLVRVLSEALAEKSKKPSIEREQASSRGPKERKKEERKKEGAGMNTGATGTCRSRSLGLLDLVLAPPPADLEIVHPSIVGP